MAESGGKSEGKSAAKSEAKETPGSDADGSDASDSAKSDAPTGYSRGENQKAVTNAYRENWDDVFGKKPRRKPRT